jgi:hypothetical protein
MKRFPIKVIIIKYITIRLFQKQEIFDRLKLLGTNSINDAWLLWATDG